MRSHTDRQSRQHSARTTLIDALRLVDQGMLDEALVGCAIAMVFLAPVTNEQRVDGMVLGLLHDAVAREQGQG